MSRYYKGLFVLALLFAAMWFLRLRIEGFANAPSANSTTFALYYADWCPHCKDVKPIFEDWGAKKGTVQIAGKTVFVKMFEESTIKDKMDDLKIQGFPTFILTKSDGTRVEYKGDRSPSAWESWLAQNI